MLEVTGVRKSFGPTTALDGVDLFAHRGEIHALIGENGAGKSTLMGVLAGVVAPDAGRVTLAGKPYQPRDPAAARAAGVAMVHQELSLCPHLTVAQNILLGREPTRGGFLSARQAEREVAAALEQLGVPLDPDALVGDLPPAARQLCEIARAVAHPALAVLILDEPTSSLAAAEVDRLFDLLGRLRDRGVAVLYISHFLEEITRIAGSFTVLRDGRTVGKGPMGSVDTDEIVRMMAGRSVERLYPRGVRTPGDVVLELQGLGGAIKPEEASLTLRRGEVLGIGGLVGAGRTELLRAIFGLDRVSRGEIKVGVHRGPASPAERLAQGVGLASEDRKGEGLATAMSIADNLTLSKLRGLGPLGLVLPARQAAAADAWIARLAIRCRDAWAPVASLSGGNQQKVALARLLYHDVDVLLLDEPTRGIDVGSKAQIYELIDELARGGKAVLMVSSYLPELLGVCDRIAVMRRGKLGPARPRAELTEHALLSEAAGASA